MNFVLNVERFDPEAEQFSAMTRYYPLTKDASERYILDIDITTESSPDEQPIRAPKTFTISEDSKTLYCGAQWIGSIVWESDMPYLTLNNLARDIFKELHEKLITAPSHDKTSENIALSIFKPQAKAVNNNNAANMNNYPY